MPTESKLFIAISRLATYAVLNAAYYKDFAFTLHFAAKLERPLITDLITNRIYGFDTTLDAIIDCYSWYLIDAIDRGYLGTYLR